MGKPATNYQPPQLDPDQRKLQPILISVFNWALQAIQRLNNCLHKDGQEPMMAPLKLVQIPTASLPAAADWKGAIVYDSTTNTVKKSDGAAWSNVP